MRFSLVALCFVAGFALAASAEAATKTWRSGGGANATSWNRAQNWSPSGAPGATDDIVIPTTPDNGSGFPVLNASSTINTLTIQSGASLTGAAGQTLTVAGSTTVTGTLNVNASSMSIGSLTGGGTVNGNTGTLSVQGDMTVTTFNGSTGTVVLDGSAAQNIAGAAYTFNNLTISNTSGPVSATASFAVNAALNMNGAATVLSPAAAVVVSGTGTLTGTGTVQVTRTAATADFSSQYTISNKTLTNLTVEYIGTAAQSVSALTYGNLRISNTSAAVSAGASFSVNGALTMNGANTVLRPAAAVLVGGTGTLSGTGTVQVTRTAATADFSSQYTISNKTLTNLTVEYNGTAAQALSAITYGGLRINNASGVGLTAGSASVGSVLTLTSGVLTTTGANTVITTADCPGSVSRTAGHVAGLLRLHVPTGSPSCTFHVGDPTNYRPIALGFASVTSAGELTGSVSQAAGDHPQIASSGIDSAIDVNRYWTLTNSGVVLGSYSAAFTFVAGDLDGGADPTTFEIERWNGSTWNTTTAAGATATTTSSTGITAFSDFVSGKKKVVFTPANGSFNVFEPATAANAVTGVIKTKVAGTGFNLDIVAIVGGAQFNGFNNENVTVDLIGNNTTGVALDAGNCPTTSSTVLASFTATINNGRSTIAFAAPANSWRDVRARVRWPTASPTVTSCSTDNFAVRPASLAIAASDATWETAGTARLLNNTAATGGNVHKASTSAAGAGARPFTLRATAAPATATNYDGTPTIAAGFPACGALCATVGGLTFSGAWGGIANTGVRDNTTANYSEAGTFTLQLEDATYADVDLADSAAGERTVPATATVEIGRFVPDYFTFIASLTPPALQAFGSSCAGRSFTYMGQPFWYATRPSATIEARNAANAVTTNYRESLSLFKLTASGIGETYSNNGVGPALNVGSAVSPPQLTAGNGTATYEAAASAANVNLAFARDPATPIAPFTANISLTVTASDSSESSVSGNGTISHASPLVFNGGGSGIAFDVGAGEFRYGRMRLMNAAGPTTVDIPLTLRAEYYQSAAAGFVLNNADNCTPLDAAHFKLTNQTGSLTGANMGDSHVSVPATVTSGIATGMKLTKASPAASGPGSVRICFDLDSGPGVGDTACVSATPANRAYLQGPWSGSSNDKDPSGQINVGTFGAQPNNFIFFRENY